MIALDATRIQLTIAAESYDFYSTIYYFIDEDFLRDEDFFLRNPFLVPCRLPSELRIVRSQLPVSC